MLVHLEDRLFIGKLMPYAFPLILTSYILRTAGLKWGRMLSMEGRRSNVYTLTERDNSPCSAAQEFSEPYLGLYGGFITYEERIK